MPTPLEELLSELRYRCFKLEQDEKPPEETVAEFMKKVIEKRKKSDSDKMEHLGIMLNSVSGVIPVDKRPEKDIRTLNKDWFHVFYYTVNGSIENPRIICGWLADLCEVCNFKHPEYDLEVLKSKIENLSVLLTNLRLHDYKSMVRFTKDFIYVLIEYKNESFMYLGASTEKAFNEYKAYLATAYE